jgi:hypothetical protein
VVLVPLIEIGRFLTGTVGGAEGPLTLPAV